MTLVRMAVARFESTPDTPTFASKAVAAAKMADSNAQKTQVIASDYAGGGNSSVIERLVPEYN
jgi:hypothetical protein